MLVVAVYVAACHANQSWVGGNNNITIKFLEAHVARLYCTMMWVLMWVQQVVCASFVKSNKMYGSKWLLRLSDQYVINFIIGSYWGPTLVGHQ
jgi:hypothetical protein